MNQSQVNCPYCNERKGTPDTKQHLYIYGAERGVHCFRCGYHRPVGIPREVQDLILGTELEAYTEPAPESKKPEFNPEIAHFRPAVKFRRARKYLNDRGVSDEWIEGLRLLYAPQGRYAERVIFPVFGENDAFVYFVARSVKDAEPKYLNCPGERNGYIFGLGDPRGNTALIVEGVFDAFAGIKAGYPSISLFGKRINAAQCRAIAASGVSRAVVLLDADALASALDVSVALSFYLPTARKELPEGQDPDRIVSEYGAAALRSIIETKNLSPLAAEVLGEPEKEEIFRGVNPVPRKDKGRDRSRERGKFHRSRSHTS